MHFLWPILLAAPEFPPEGIRGETTSYIEESTAIEEELADGLVMWMGLT